MPGVPEFIVKWVSTQSDMVALVGTRVTPWQATRKDARPRITYTQVSGERVRGLAGPLMVARQRWQLDCWGGTPAEARAVARCITGWTGESRLDGYRGYLAGIQVQSCILEDERDNSEPLTPGDDAGSPCVTLDFNIAWNTV